MQTVKPFVHLRVHSEYSMADSTISFSPLFNQLRALGMPAVGLTDLGNLHAARKFSKAAVAAGIQPIIGCDVMVRDPAHAGSLCRILLLCQSETGYQNLVRLLSRGCLESGQAGEPVLDKSWLTLTALEGLIVLSGAQSGDVGQALLAGRLQDAEGLAIDWEARAPERFYLEVQRTGHHGQETCNQRTIDLGCKLGLPVAATHGVQFLEPGGYMAHEARVCIADNTLLHDRRRHRLFSPDQYLKSPEEMYQLFGDLPQAVENTVLIAQRCGFFVPSVKTVMPHFPVPVGNLPPEDMEKQLLDDMARQGLITRMRASMTVEAARAAWKRYSQRLEDELDMIKSLGFAGYFLIVSDFIRWAKDNGVRVGPGRGSGAGSLVAWCLRITDLDPLQYDLLFERFINPERVSLPDFDVDFSRQGRDRVIDYVKQRYGGGRVCQIATFGTLAARAVINGLGKAMHMPEKAYMALSRLIPMKPGMTLEQAQQIEPRINERIQERSQVAELFDLAGQIEGLTRNVGVHAGGVIIAPDKICRYVPICLAPGSGGILSQFDKDDCEEVGLIKYDFLGLKTLDIIELALHYIADLGGGAPVDLDRLPLDDADTYQLIGAGDTTEVFQLSSLGMKDLVRRLLPDRFEDLIALVALYRPGPLGSGMVDQFIACKHGRQTVTYLHPLLEEVLRPTYGVVLYQEQVMLIARVLAGYSLGAADILRRAMGKKKPEEMARQREVFVKGAVANQVPEAQAVKIFDVMEKFAEYGFNKSHSAAYALLTYQTAYLKAHYRAAFMAAALSFSMDDSDKIRRLLIDCRDAGLSVLGPDINQSGYRFRPVANDCIRYGLGAVKNTGQKAIEFIEAARNGGNFASFADFCARVDSRHVNRRVIEALIMAGAFDALEPNRAQLHESLDELLERQGKQQPSGQADLFGGLLEPSPAPPATVAEWDPRLKLENERKALGFYYSGHPFDTWEDELAGLEHVRIHDLKPHSRRVIVAGIIERIKEVTTRKNGRRMAFVTLSDASGEVEVTVFPDLYAQCRDKLVENSLLLVAGVAELDQREEGGLPADESGDEDAALRHEEPRAENIRIKAFEVWDLEGARVRFGQALELTVKEELLGDGCSVDLLLETIRPWADGTVPLVIHYANARARCDIALGRRWQLKVDEKLLAALASRFSTANVQVRFRRPLQPPAS